MEGAGCGRLPFDKTQPVDVSRTAEHSAPEWAVVAREEF